MKYQPKILLFLLLILILLWFTSGYWEGWLVALFSILFSLSVFLIGIVIFLENRNPSKTLTWLIVLASFPLVGFVFYILFGRYYRRKRMFELKHQMDAEEFSLIEGYTPYDTTSYLENVPEHQYRFFQLASRIGNTPISFRSKASVLTNGDQTYGAMIQALSQAEHHIHLEYYIVRDDGIGRKIQHLLIEKAEQGVEVRFIFDSVGCFQLPYAYLNKLEDAGVQITSFNPVTFPLLNSKVNFRNHRKIMVIDGTIGFVGGLNIGDEYLGKNESIGLWRDTHLKVEREVVRSLQISFLLDWYYMTGQKLLEPQYLSPNLSDDIEEQDQGIQIIAGGPDHEWEVLKKLFLSMITSAIKKVDIASPYLIPDDDMLSAIKMVALSGVEVNIILPNKPDKKIVFWGSRSYFHELLETGVNIYLYNKGFMHSKVIIVDEELASIGSANMDMRSFHLNFEVNAFLYSHDGVKQLVKDFNYDLQNADIVEFDVYKQRKIRHRIYESLARLFAPLL